MVRGRSLKRKSAQTSRPRRRVVPRRKASAEQKRTELRLGRDVAFLLPKKATALAIASLGNRQRPILPGRVQVRYQTLALGSSLTLPSSYARYSVLSCDSGGTLPFVTKKETTLAVSLFW